MPLKAPRAGTFLVSVILAIGIFHGNHFVPGHAFDDSWQFLGLLTAYFILALGCTVRGM